MRYIDSVLNRFTMYRLVVYVLGAYAGLSIFFAQLGKLSSSPTQMIVSLGLLIAATYVVDRGLSRLLAIPSNQDSWLITALILFLIIQPADSVTTGLVLVLAGALAIASKFLLAIRGKHLFNPAAFAAATLSLWGYWPATWWVGSSRLWPFTAPLGLVVVRKVRRFPMVITFGVVAVVLQAILLLHGHQALSTSMKQVLLASPLIFLSTIMLTEPATMPPRRNLQMVFGALVAVLYITAWKLGSLVIYPEVALLLGNIFAYAVSPKFRVRLKLLEVRRISERVYSYVFQPDRRFSWLPGQYMEWTLAGVPYDNRGNRRTFTIASSPTESTVQVGVKYYEPASTYKAALHELQPGDTVYGSQLAGNFTLRGHEQHKLAFIAGGIGITPFRSMVKYLTDTKRRCDIVLLYAVDDPAELAYRDELKAAGPLGVTVIPVIGRLQASRIKQAVPDYAERHFYVSGPPGFVDAAKDYLYELEVPGHRIKTDHFSGY